MTKIVAVLGSVTPPGRLSAAIAGCLERASRDGRDVELIDLAGVRLDFADGRAPADHDDDSAAIIARLEAADAVVLASPVYRASFSGALKNLLDLAPVEALMGKPCGIVAMGATQHHYLGVDRHLRDVLSWFGALVAPTSVYLTSADFENGQPAEAAASALDSLLRTLTTLCASSGERAPELGPRPLAAARAPTPR